MRRANSDVTGISRGTKKMVFTAGIFNASITRGKRIILKFEAGRTSFQTIKGARLALQLNAH